VIAALRDRRMAWPAIVGLVLAWGLPEIGIPGRLFPGDAVAVRIGREAIWWAFGAIILCWVVFVERLPLVSIGLRPPRLGTIIWGIVFAILLMASFMLSYAVIFPALGLHQNMRATHNIIAVPFWLQYAMMLRAGVIEEILYRGYPIERIEGLTGRTWLAAVVSVAIFIAVHISYWGYAQLIVVAFGAVLLTALYLWRRDLPACMIAHFLADFVGFALARLQS